jgi:acyl-coenzyme A synthetase/AMP-(fatty) acid ligase
MIEHRAIENHMRWMMDAFPAATDGVILLKTPLSFDASVWEVWLPLLTGATLAVAQPGDHKDPNRLMEEIRRRRVTTLQVVPSMLRALLDTGGLETCTTLRHVFCGGEALSTELVDRFLGVRSDWELINLYGPTETTIDATWRRCRKGEDRAGAAIGRPLPNVQARVVDRGGEDVPAGVVGELLVGGEGVARGYVGQPELTAEKFSTSADGVRWYRTGDLARFLSDGVIEYVGRNDDQVKLRGFRIELGEIESVLLQHPSVKEASVVVRRDGGLEFLAAYVVPVADGDEKALDEHARRVLPEHMAPAAFVFLDAMPLTPNGKIDREALPRPERQAPGTAFTEPRDAVERALATIWMDVLELNGVGVHENFFELGGHSLLALKVISRVRRSLGVDLSLAKFFDLSTIADVAIEVRSGAPAENLPGGAHV